MARYGPNYKLVTFTTNSANMMIREIGISLFLAAVGLARFNIARPTRRDRTLGPDLGGDDLEARAPFGIKWSEKHLFEHSPHNGIEFYREQLEKLKPQNVVWQPYLGKIELFHPKVARDSRFFLARVPMIHFWMVEYHYPDRVMR